MYFSYALVFIFKAMRWGWFTLSRFHKCKTQGLRKQGTFLRLHSQEKSNMHIEVGQLECNHYPQTLLGLWIDSDMFSLSWKISLRQSLFFSTCPQTHTSQVQHLQHLWDLITLREKLILFSCNLSQSSWIRDKFYVKSNDLNTKIFS